MSTLSALPLRALFASDITRDIPPVVYFHEQSPDKLADEVAEYIITGGWPETHPNHRRVPNGIHEQYKRLLTHIAEELDKRGGPELPCAWVSGFFGSGKSSFAKLLGLALDGATLPSGQSVADALLARDSSPLAPQLAAAWAHLRGKIEPIAAVFDIGGVARDDEHIHAVAVRQVQQRLGYSTKSAHIAFAELDIERDGRWPAFTDLVTQTYGRPWSALKDEPQAPARFSNLMARLYPDIYRSERDWHIRHGGTLAHTFSPEEAITTLRDMLRHRRPNATLFLVVDEVSQYVIAHPDRVERLRAFASALGAGLKGKVWLIALGQQKLEEDADAAFLVKTKDRFPQKLRVHLAATNIRDVVHKRLLQKKPAYEAPLRDLFAQHRADLALYAYGCEQITPDELVDVYPLLPSHIDLLLQITSALRTRSSRAQGDDQAIRGLLQLLGELFRGQGLAERPVGHLITLDQIYEVQHTALDSEVLASMARIHSQCAHDDSGLLLRVAKAVALLELIAETTPTQARLVAQCLYSHFDQGNQLPAVEAALEELRRRNLLGYTEKLGYKIQSSSAEEWERDRRDISVPREAISTRVQTALTYLLGTASTRPTHLGRGFPFAATFSDGRTFSDATLADPRDEACLRLDLRFLPRDERGELLWIERSGESTLQNRLLWLGGESEELEERCREWHRSAAMVARYKPRRESLSDARKLLLQQEENREQDLQSRIQRETADCFLRGRLYFRGRAIPPTEHGAAFVPALLAVATQVLPALFPHFNGANVAPAEIAQLLSDNLNGIPSKFVSGDLALLELDNDRYVPQCSGVIPRRVLEHIQAEGGLSGTALLAHFGSPPYGYPAGVVKACVAGLLRASKLRIQPDGGAEINAVRDPDARDLFDRDRSFRRANLFAVLDDEIGVQTRARICKFFLKSLNQKVDREDHLIADAVCQYFPPQARRLRDVLSRLDQLPGRPKHPEPLIKLQDTLEQCLATSRQTRPTVQLVKARLDALNDGLDLLSQIDAELTPEAIATLRRAALARDHHLVQLDAASEAAPLAAEAQALRELLAAERPWKQATAAEAPTRAITARYAAVRRAQLQAQETACEAARQRIKARAGFSTLSPDQSHHVLRPIALALTDTTDSAIAPSLSELHAPFLLRLERAEAAANAELDALTSHRTRVVPLDLRLRNRELTTTADVEALLGELRARLLDRIQAGDRVRIL